MAIANMLQRAGSVLLVAMLLLTATTTFASRLLVESNVHQAKRSLLQTHGTLLTDYIGASGDTSLQFTDVPLAAGVSYIFPLSFAIDADAAGNTADGVFSPYWASSLSPAAALAFTQANSQVKLVASLAGASQFISDTNTRQVVWYDPPSTTDWINHAVSSITQLVSQYGLAGIDIDYENFPQGSATFTECIGGLITNLKNNNIVSEVSIAPFGNTLTMYTDLFNSVGTLIDHVNYQFYADDLTTQDEYVAKFNSVQSSFPGSQLLASVEVDGRGLQGQDFISAAEQVTIAGIMIFDVDNSKKSNFAIENLASAYLSGN